MNNNLLNSEINNNSLYYLSSNISQDKVRVAWENENMILMPGDSIIVKEATKTVTVLGEVYNPGLIEFDKEKSLRYYINSAGGITQIGSKYDVIVIYANGVVRPKKLFSSPKIKDGCLILINRKQNTEPINITQFATNWTSIISSMITAVILSKQLSSSN